MGRAIGGIGVEGTEEAAEERLVTEDVEKFVELEPAEVSDPPRPPEYGC
jgi:hypothetical protein